jgi:hypothetical protein
MRFFELNLNEEIEIISEKYDVDVTLQALIGMGFKNAEKKTKTKIKVVVPNKERIQSVDKIVAGLKKSGVEATPSADHKIVNIDGVDILVKPAEAQGGRLEKEVGQRNSIDTAIKGAMNGQPEITLTVGNRQVQAAGAIGATPGWKADIAIVDAKGTPTAWVSLKDGNSPKNFQGWGGITHHPVVDHEEVKDFVAALQLNFGNTMPQGTAVGRVVQDQLLKNQVVFGKNFGGEPGESNVDLVLQGAPKVVPGKGGFVLTGDHTWANGQTPSGGYDPVLIASYRADRNNFGVKGARLFMYSAGGRKFNSI